MAKKPNPKAVDRPIPDRPRRSASGIFKKKSSSPGSGNYCIVVREGVATTIINLAGKSIVHRPVDPIRRPLKRFSANTLAVVKHAAKLEGRSVNDFIAIAARKAAHRTIQQTQIILLSTKEQRHFVEVLLDPPALAPALKRAQQAHAQLVRATP